MWVLTPGISIVMSTGIGNIVNHAEKSLNLAINNLNTIPWYGSVTIPRHVYINIHGQGYLTIPRKGYVTIPN